MVEAKLKINIIRDGKRKMCSTIDNPKDMSFGLSMV
jgi:hypothetical protein